MNNTSAWAMLLAYMNLSNIDGSGETTPLWAVILVFGLLALVGILFAYMTYNLIIELIEERRKRRKELWKK